MPSNGTVRHAQPGVTVWLTGLSGAGKSTLAAAVAEQLGNIGLDTEMLDGDQLRASLCSDLGFSRQDRDTHVRRVGFLAQLLSSHGVVTLVPVIAPYAMARAEVRERHQSRDTAYLEVHVATPLSECARRDPKGLYARAERGELSGMTGVDDPYEEPESPELRLDTTSLGISEAASQVVQALQQRGLIRQTADATH